LLVPPKILSPGFAAGVFSCLIAVAFVPWWSGSAISLRWILIALGSTVALWLPIKARAEHWVGGAFLIFAAVSLAWSDGPYDGINELAKLCFLAGIFLIGQNFTSIRSVYIGLALGFAVNSAIVIAQWYGLQWVPQIVAPSGLFGNKNYLAESAAMLLLALIASRLWWFIPGVLPSVFLPWSRGAIAGLIAGFVVWVWTKSKTAAVILALCVMLGSGILYQQGYGVSSIGERMLIYKSTIAGMTWTGSGIGSFFVRFPTHAPEFNFFVTRPVHAHNDILELTYELGPGILFYLAFLTLALSGPFGAEKLMLIAFLMEGCFAFPLHMPVTAFMAALATGNLCRDRVSLRRLFVARRAAIRLSLAAYRATLRKHQKSGIGAYGIPV
jgi:hypothetical protein